MRVLYVRTLSLAIVLSLLSATSPARETLAKPLATVEKPFFFNSGYNAADPGQIIGELRPKAQCDGLGFEESMDYASAWFLLRRWDRAAMAYEGAVREADSPAARATALYFAAQSAMMAGHFREAGEMMNAACRLETNSAALAAQRLACWAAAGDDLERRVAENRLAELDVRVEGAEVCSIGTIIIVMVVAYAAVALYAIHEDKLDDPMVQDILTQMSVVGKLLGVLKLLE